MCRHLTACILFSLVFSPSIAVALDETVLGRFDRILSDMESGDLIPLRAEATRRVILAKANQEAKGQAEGLSPSERREIVQGLLGKERYDRAVEIFAENLSHPVVEYRAASANFLGEAMGAVEAAPALRKQLNFEGARMFGDLEVPENFELNITSLLAEAEALAYLRDPKLIETGLLTTLLESNPPSDSAARIIKAMAYARVPGWQKQVLPYLKSETPEVAKAAFIAMRQPEFLKAYAKPLLDGAQYWIPIFRKHLDEAGELDWNEKVLFSVITSVGSSIQRDVVGFSPDLSGVRDDLKDIVNMAPTDLRRVALVWFRFYDNDSDAEWLLKLLKEEDPLTRERILYLVGKTLSPEVIIDYAGDIFPLLNDPNRMVQGFAVFALQSGLELPAATLYSDRELAEAKRKVLEAYAEKGIEPNPSGEADENG